MPVVKGKYLKPVIRDLLEHARKRAVLSDADSHTIRRLANEVIRLRNATPCKRCLGTPGRMTTGTTYMGGDYTYGPCDKCKGHKGKMYKRMKRV